MLNGRKNIKILIILYYDEWSKKHQNTEPHCKRLIAYTPGCTNQAA